MANSRMVLLHFEIENEHFWWPEFCVLIQRQKFGLCGLDGYVWVYSGIHDNTYMSSDDFQMEKNVEHDD